MNNKPWVIITGADGGIGKALVNVFAEEGYRIIATDIKPIEQENENVYPLQTNLEEIVLNEAYAEAFHNEIIEITKRQPIQSLINNAATQILNPTDKITRNEWFQSFNVNLSAPFFLSQLFLKDLIQSKHGSIVNISSIHAIQTKRDFVTYATTKGALSSLTRNMAVDLGGSVRVNAIEPAAVSTDMLKAGFEGKNEEYKMLEAFHPIARIATPVEVAQLAVYLCSDKASFIHGACINATGGIHGCLSDPDVR
ncbi:SDR family NAD(P)-dependent oxidoreductase [Paraglaciecola marina]|uniref:SDR family NAD(P)-dependent oxidoreductase n=1 Tax=Paraglaciecola marina TaxID=2500157 RepID=UPI00105D04F1|nr:SDR family oxidoreductase [Paraglaciecola marina]